MKDDCVARIVRSVDHIPCWAFSDRPSSSWDNPTWIDDDSVVTITTVLSVGNDMMSILKAAIV